MHEQRQGGARGKAGAPKRGTKGRNDTRLLALLGIGAVLAAGLLVTLGALGERGGDDLGGIPQSGTILGDGRAPVTIRLYEDFQCPACAQFARGTLPEVVDRYVRPGDAKLVSETMVFLGPDSATAARAAFAAGEQDRYWQYALLLFENQGAENSGHITDGFLKDQADRIEGLDVGRWQEARGGGYEEELRSAQGRAVAAGISSTPSLEVSGPGGERLLRGAVPMSEVERAVEAVR